MALKQPPVDARSFLNAVQFKPFVLLWTSSHSLNDCLHSGAVPAGMAHEPGW
ncbi:Hypothetical protein SynRCC307_1085 [Synechococcus sp. RCC307]|nr:Hypothetical protein SynRCC307_1085 [Synechococcus sp. RCC307]